jgi:hypothetical protein
MSEYRYEESEQTTGERYFLNSLWLVIVVILLYGLISCISGCATTQTDWAAIAKQIEEYKDQIPPEYIEQIKEALKDIK